jgi:hypothetical protein
LSGPERTQFFRNLSTAADLVLQQQDSARNHNTFLAHQLYLRVGWNHSPDVGQWLRTVNAQHLKRFPKFERWSPQWLERRSLVIALASHGDPEPIQRFLRTAHGSDECEMANLNYWAYWAGELRERQRSQDFMVDSKSLRSWTGVTLLRRLTDKFVSSNPNLELNIHSVAVLLRRPLTARLLEQDAELTASIRARVGGLLDHNVPMSADARTELDFIHQETSRLPSGRCPQPSGQVN